MAAASSVVARPARLSEHAIVTYNILSEALCKAKDFSRYEPSLLDVEARWAGIERKLKAAMADECVIGLQEVSVEWAQRIAPLCASLGYEPIWRLSGSEFSGSMGVALLVPTTRYEICKVRIERVGRIVTELVPVRSAADVAAAESSFSVVLRVVGSFVRLLLPPIVKAPLDFAWRSLSGLFGFRTRRGGGEVPWREARSRHNSVVYAALKDQRGDGKSKLLGCATYHNPCRFRGRSRGVMTLHAWALARRALEWAEKDGAALVLGGDFNFKPEDRQYRLLSTGSLLTDEEEKERVERGAHVDDDPRGSGGGKFGPQSMADFDGALPTSLRSAYAEAEGAEPDFTNYNHADMVGPTPFVDTLDYIWLGPGAEATGAVTLPMRSDAGGPFPSAEEPSDHVMVRVSVRV